MKIEVLSVDSLKPYERNARRHEDADIQTIVNSIKEFGFNDPIGIWGPDNLIVEGHGRLLAAKRLGMTEVPCIRLDHLTDEQRRAYALAHNKTAEMSSWLDEMLDIELGDISDIDMAQFGFDLASETDGMTEINNVSLADKYLVPPFSVIYGNKGDWLKRKRAWIQFGIKSEIGRGGTCVSTSRMDGETITPDER